MVVKTEGIACNLCGSYESNTLFNVRDYWLENTEIYGVVKCLHCGLTYLNPRPRLEEIHKLYPAEFYNINRSDADVLSGWDNEINHQKASYISANPPGTCFEVGAYWGDFLYYMKKKGWSVSGCELSNHPRDVFGLEIFRGKLEDAGIQESSIDVVAAWAVLEHVYDPLGLCKEIYRILKPGGQFVFTVPNFNSVGGRLLHGDDYPRHVYFFTKSSIRRLASKAGFLLDRFWFDNKLFSLSAFGICEFKLREYFGLNFEAYLHEKRSFTELTRRSKLSVMQKAKEVGFFWTCVRLVDHILAPAVDRISMLTQHYGTMTCCLFKNR